MNEIDNDKYEIYASPGQSEDIIVNLFPGKYITVCRHVYYGDYDYDGNSVSDVVEYTGNGERLYYVGGGYDEDVNKPLGAEKFDKLDEEYVIKYEPKYESFEFIESDKFTTLQEYVLNRKKD